jgi:hypothetical protein
MKYLVCALALLFTTQLSFLSFARASTIHQFDGEYAFDGTVEPVGRLTVDVVDKRMPDAENRLMQIKAEGGNCTHVTSLTVRCTKMNPGATVPVESLVRIAERSKDLSVRFGQRTGAPTLVSKAEALTEWQIPQNGETPLGIFDKFRYLELQGLVKVIFPYPQGNFELNTLDGRHLRKFESVTVYENRWRWHQDMAQVILTAR